MTEIIDTFITHSTEILVSLGPIAGIIMIIVESILPILPLSVFITLNIASFGTFFGFLISWLATIVGCMLSFTLFRYFFRDKLYRFIKKNYEALYANPNLDLTRYKVHFSEENFNKIMMLVTNYKTKYANYLN